MNEIVYFPMEFTSETFYSFCIANQNMPYTFQLIKPKEVLMTPRTPKLRDFVEELHFDFGLLNGADGAGKLISNESGYLLPDGKILVADIAWLSRENWKKLSVNASENDPIAPNFVAVVIENSLNLKIHQENMWAWIWHGASLAWLIDLEAEKVYIYKPEAEVKISDFDEILTADEIMDDFEIDLQDIKERLEED